MTVKFFIDQDSEGRQWAPDYSHEAAGVFEILEGLWRAFHHEDGLYVAIANLHDPSADLIIITERGLGLVEIKHYQGMISMGGGGYWYAGDKQIRAGKYLSPHRQVQEYGDEVRSKIKMFMPKSDRFDDLNFQTAVCFTNHDADLKKIRHQLKSKPPQRKPWESQFSIGSPNDIPRWTASLRFEVDLGYEQNYEPYRLNNDRILQLVEWRLNGTEWTEAYSLMPDGKPYGYFLNIDEHNREQIYSLYKDEMLIGRDAEECQIEIPPRYSRTSRCHARVVRQLDGIYIEDLDSSNGTYVDGIRIQRPHALNHGDLVSLGAPHDRRSVFKIWYSHGPTPPAEPLLTVASE